jgi:hypothetical protein
MVLGVHYQPPVCYFVLNATHDDNIIIIINNRPAVIVVVAATVSKATETAR